MSWEQLAAMVQEAREIDQADRAAEPTSCASCYTPLKPGPDGGLFCPWDGLRWPEDAGSWGEFPGAF